MCSCVSNYRSLGNNFEISIKQITAEDFTDKKMQVTEFIRKYTEQRKVSTNYTQLQRNVIPYLLSQPVHAMEAVEDGYCVSLCFVLPPVIPPQKNQARETNLHWECKILVFVSHDVRLILFMLCSLNYRYVSFYH